MRRRLILALLPVLILVFGIAAPSARAQQLVMVEEPGCVWCERWNREIAEIYPKTPEGRMAPLRRIDKRAPTPEDLQFTVPPFFTPTFILVQDGRELARIEGYPGEDFFWGLLGKMLEEHTDFTGAS